jgi:hypothetical protein
MRTRVKLWAGMVVGLALSGIPSAPAWAQARAVVVPIVIQAPRPAVAPSARIPSVSVTSRTLSPAPGLTTTRVTVENTTGRALGVLPPSRVGARDPAPAPPMAAVALPPSVTRSRITLQDTTVGAPRIPGRGGVPVGVGGLAGTAVPVGGVGPVGAAVTGAGVPGRAPVTVEITQWQTGLGRQHVSITTDGPIDAPIVILTQ